MAYTMTPEEIEQYHNEGMSELLGGTITNATVKRDGDDYWPTLIVKAHDGSMLRLTVSRDDEGNGPGALWIDPADTSGIDEEKESVGQ